jgi:DNA-binding winged helix-turn-helix (wHTH) protein
LIKRQEQQPMCRDNAARLRPQSRPAAADPVLEFGRFRVPLRQRQLLADQVPIELGTRAFDLLLVLLETNGSLVTKEELLNRVWPGIVVSEGNLKVQVSALRKALGEDRGIIRTEFGLGYRFTGVVHATAAAGGHFAPPSGGAIQKLGFDVSGAFKPRIAPVSRGRKGPCRASRVSLPIWHGLHCNKSAVQQR